MTIRLSRLARQDLDDIRRYTLDTWGRGQWLKYYRGLVGVFEGIMANPDVGRDRSLFAAGLRSVNYEKHVIFFVRVAAADDAPMILMYAMHTGCRAIERTGARDGYCARWGRWRRS